MKRPLLGICLCLIALLALRYFGSETDLPSYALDRQEGESIVLTGQICEIQNEKIYLNSVTMDSVTESKNSNINSDLSFFQQHKQNKWQVCCELQQEAKGKLQIGDCLTISGVWGYYPQATNPGEFDLRAYYKILRVSGKLQVQEILQIKKGTFTPKKWACRLRDYFLKRLYRVFPKKEAGILAAMLLGQKQDLDRDIKELYRDNGIIHILSISGLHISFLGMGLFELLRKAGLGPKLSALAGGIVLLFYGLMVGMPISACRAIGMYLLRMASFWVGRTYDLLTALGVLAAVILLENPAYLEHSGFWLSFLSLFGVAGLAPFLEKMLPFGGRAAKIFGTCSGIFLATLPAQLWFYYEIPLWSWLLNLLVLPFTGVLVGIGFLVLLLPGSGWLGTICCLILTYYEGLCRVTERFEIAKWNPGQPARWQIVAYCVGFGALWIAFGRGKRKERTSLSQAILFYGSVFLLVVGIGFHFEQTPKVTFLDVGQGDCAVVQGLDGVCFVFDCGSTGKSKVGEKILLPYLKKEGICRIQGLFLSHADEDHISGAIELLEIAGKEHIAVDEVILPGYGEVYEILPDFGALSDSLEKYREKKPIRLKTIRSGEGFSWKGGELLCLHPNRRIWEGENANSEVFLLSLWKQTGKDRVRILLTGDLEGEGETEVLSELSKRKIHVDLLKVAHHGSKYSTTDRFLMQVRPQIAVISAGRNNRYGHPHEELLERLKGIEAGVLRTDLQGAISLKLRRDGYELLENRHDE